MDEFDYAEPSCPLCGGRAFYHPQKNDPDGHIPVSRVIEKVDALFARNRYEEAGRLLTYWRDEAISLKDKSGELSIQNELVGYYRKQNDRENALYAVGRAMELVDELHQGEMASGATILLNCATAYKAFDLANCAMPLYRRAEKVYQNTLSQNDARFGGLYNNMALALCDLARYEEAEEAYQSALAVMAKAEQGEAECAITYINLAHLYDTWGKREQIVACMEQAYALLQSERLTRDGFYAFVLEKCAPSFGYFGHADRAAAMQKEAKAIYARA